MRTSGDFDLPKRALTFTIIVFVLFIVCSVVMALTSTYLKPWEVGIKQVKFGLTKGFYEGYKGGNTYLRVPLRDTIIHVPTNLRYILIHADRTPDDKIVEGTGLVVPTTDGQKVTSDVSIAYRVFKEANLPPEVANEGQTTEQVAAVQATADVVAFKEANLPPEVTAESQTTEQVVAVQATADVAKAEAMTKEKAKAEARAKEKKDLALAAEEAQKIGFHGGPLQLITQFGTNSTIWNQRVQQIAEDASKRALGHLTTDDYYNSMKREKMCYLAQKMLNEGWLDEQGVAYTGLHAYGIHVEGILIRAYTFPEIINTAIFNKVTQVQKANLNKAKEEMERQAALVTKVEAEGKANMDVKLTEADAEVTKIDSEADLYKKSKEAEGDLLVETEKAKVTELKSNAFKMNGGDLYVARQLKELPLKVNGGVLTAFNPLSVTSWLELVTTPKSASPRQLATQTNQPQPALAPPVSPPPTAPALTIQQPNPVNN